MLLTVGIIVICCIVNIGVYKTATVCSEVDGFTILGPYLSTDYYYSII